MMRAATAIVVGLITICFFPSPAGRQAVVSAQTPQQRLSWQEFSKDPNRVKSLVAAFQALRDNDKASPTSADYRRSLQYWGAIHGYYGPKSPRGTVENAIANLKQNGLPQFVGFFEGVTDLTPPDALAAEVWNTCKHSGFRQDGTFVQSTNFFGWHRIYLYYFEQVLRTLAKDDTLRLPYWDYTNTSQLAFPPEFGNGQNGPVNPPLFDFRRTQGLNDGLVNINPDLTDIDWALDIGEYLGEDGYQWAIEGNTHGNVHCAVGNTCPVPLMGSVGLSANDPIFWLHHANIDRLWDCWITKHGVPSGDWANQKYVFPDGAGNRQERTVSEFLKQTEYVYDNVANCARVPPPSSLTKVAPQGPKGTPMVVASASKISMPKSTTTVKLTMPSDERAKSLTAAVAPAQTDGTSVELVLNNITIEKAPASLLAVYLVGPNGARQRAGTINFFGQGDAGGHEHAGLTRRFDVTRQLRELYKGASPANISVTIESASGVRGAPGRNAPAELTTPKWDGVVTIGSIELQLRPRAK
jgi:hypothetical protein